MKKKRYWSVGTEDGKLFLVADLKGTWVGPDGDYSLWPDKELAETIAEGESKAHKTKLVAREYKP